MKRWTLLVTLLALIAGGVWIWREFFPAPERVIRQRIKEIAGLASFSPKEAPAAKLLNSQKLAGFFTSDVVIQVNVPGYAQTITGRDDLAQVALMAREHLSSLKVEVSDIIVVVAPDKQSAMANLTGRASSPGQIDFMVQELKLSLKPHGRDWLINRVETVKTLR